MESIRGVIDDSDDENEEEKKPRIRVQRVIQNPEPEKTEPFDMFKHIEQDFEKRFGKTETKEPMPPTEPKKHTLEILENFIALAQNELNKDAELIELQKEELVRLEEDVGKRNVRSIELNSALQHQLSKIEEMKKTLVEGSNLLIGKEKELKQKIEVFNVQVSEFNATVESHKKKRKGTTRKIKQTAKTEFDKET